MLLKHLLPNLLPTLEINDIEIKNLQNDSRQVQPGDLFLAYPGHQADGRLFIEDAIRSGAVAILYEPGIIKVKKDGRSNQQMNRVGIYFPFFRKRFRHFAATCFG